jgi:hypothetical protein
MRDLRLIFNYQWPHLFRAGFMRAGVIFVGALVAALPGVVLAQESADESARARAPVDLTGYWVSVISEDWRWRMVTPAKGDFANVPLNDEGRLQGNTWDPAADEAAGEECRSFGAPAIMRVPGRVHISWEDDNTLRIDTDAGTQTRLLHFGGDPESATDPSWQGYSSARWEGPSRALTQGRSIQSLGVGIGGADLESGRSLEVVTTQLQPGYHRRNGVPYSDEAVVNEYFDLSTEPNGDTWFSVTTIVEDPRYLDIPFVTSTNFKRQDNDDGWNPTPCTSR